MKPPSLARASSTPSLAATKKMAPTDVARRTNAMKMSGAGTTIERHGMSRALDSTPTAEMRKQLGALAGDALPTQPGTEPAFLLDLSEKLNRWIEDYRHREQKPASSSWFQLFVDIDQDRDGLITYDELVSTIRRKLKQPKSVLSDTVIQALWCALDVNDSNAIDPEEMARFLKLASPKKPKAGSVTKPGLDYYETTAEEPAAPASRVWSPPKSTNPFGILVASAPWKPSSELGSFWPRAERDSGSLALMEKKRLQLAANAPESQLTWGPSHWPQPSWAARPASALTRGGAGQRAPSKPRESRPAVELRRSASSSTALFVAPPAALESTYSLEMAAKSWRRNRGGGGFWPKAERHSGSLALIDRRRLELAATAPDTTIGWSSVYSAGWKEPSWADAERKRLAALERKRLASPRVSRPSSGLIAATLSARTRSPDTSLAPEMVMRRPAFWPPLDASGMRYAHVEQLLELLSNARPLTDMERAVPKVATCHEHNGEAVGGAGAAAAAEASCAPRSPGFLTLAVSASSNQLSSIAELPRVLTSLLADATMLVSLDLSANSISSLPPSLATLTALEVLRLHKNKISNLEEIDHLEPLPKLTRLTLFRNPIEMTPITSLARLALKHNPFAALEEHDPKAYRLRVLARLPRLRQLDQMAITTGERKEVAGLRGNKRGRAR